MKVQRWVHEGSTPTYLVGDEETGIAFVIDPPRYPGQVLDEAERLGLSIGHVFFTGDLDGPFPPIFPFQERGAHADGGSRSIPRADVTPLLPGSSITIGRIRLQAEQHALRRVAYRVYERGDDGEQVLVLDVLPGATCAGEPPGGSGECDGYPRSSFLHSFSRW